MIIKKETTNSSFFGLPDTCIIQYPFGISACGKDYFATAQNICIHILFLTLRLTSESRTERPEIIQLHRHVIEQIPFQHLDQIVDNHSYHTVRHSHTTFGGLFIKLGIIHCTGQQRTGYIFLCPGLIETENSFLDYIL